MKPLHLRAVIFAAVTLAATLLTAWLLFGRGALPIQTDLLAMLPATERDALAEKAVEKLANASGDRMVLLVAGDDDNAKAAARALGRALAADKAFESVTAELPPFDLADFVQPYLPHRFGMLDEVDRQAIASPDYDPAAALTRQLNQPFVDAVTVSMADDPFGWLGRWLAAQPWSSSTMTPEDDLLVAHDDERSYVMVLATLAGSAYDNNVQRAGIAALTSAWKDVHARWPDVELLRTGAVFYAAAARDQAEHDLHLIGAVSGLGIALLLLLVFRSPGPLGVAFLSTVIGILGALCVSLLLFGKVYLLTLVFGAALLGEAVDYSIQYLTARANAGSRWNAAAGVRQVRPALLIAVGTSLLGYGLLGLVPFPPLKQMAVFAMAGMLIACFSVLWLLPAMLSRPARPFTPAVVRGARVLQHATARLATGRRGWIVAAILLLLMIPGWCLLSHDDDIRLLISPPPELNEQEARIRDVTGVGNGTQFFLVRGDSTQQVLEREEALEQRLQAQVDAGTLPGWVGIAAMAPSARRQAENLALLQPLFADPERMHGWLVGAGFRAEAADAYIDAWPGTPLAFDDWRKMPMASAFQYLWIDADDGGPASIVVPREPEDLVALHGAAKGLEGVSLVDKPASVSELFGRYRRYASLWLVAALLLIAPVFAWRYGWRHMPRVLAPSVLGLGLTLATLGYLGQPLTLFHWLGLMLVLGVGANYAVFLHEGEPFTLDRPGAMYTSVLLSALTALLSFGLLSLSSMPALSGFGLTLLLGIGFTALLVPVSGWSSHTPVSDTP